MLSKLTNPIEREIYISKVASSQNISYEIIRSQVDGAIIKEQRTKENREWKNIMSSTHARDVINPEAKTFPKEAKAESGIFVYLLRNCPDHKIITNIDLQ